MRLHKHKLVLQVFLYEGTMHMLASVMCQRPASGTGDERVLKIYSASWSFEMGAKQCPPPSADQAFEMTYESPQPRNRIPRIFPFVPSAFSLNPTSFFLFLSCTTQPRFWKMQWRLVTSMNSLLTFILWGRDPHLGAGSVTGLAKRGTGRLEQSLSSLGNQHLSTSTSTILPSDLSCRAPFISPSSFFLLLAFLLRENYFVLWPQSCARRS